MSTMSIGQRITYARKKRGISQKNLAEMLHVNNQQLNRWEKGVRNPKMEVLNTISNILVIRDGYFSRDLDSSDNIDYFLPVLEDNELFFNPDDFHPAQREDYIQAINGYFKLMDTPEIIEVFEKAVHIVHSKEPCKNKQIESLGFPSVPNDESKTN